VLDILVQDRRNSAAAKCFFKRLLHGLKYKPRCQVTDGLRSYGVAQRAVLPDVRHRTSGYLNNRSREFASTNSPTRGPQAEARGLPRSPPMSRRPHYSYAAISILLCRDIHRERPHDMCSITTHYTRCR
jgi:putative transposase